MDLPAASKVMLCEEIVVGGSNMVKTRLETFICSTRVDGAGAVEERVSELPPGGISHGPAFFVAYSPAVYLASLCSYHQADRSCRYDLL